MIEVGPARESDVVLAFLRAEIDYRDGLGQVIQTLGVTKHELIDDADVANDYYNALRAILLDSYRGYLSRTLFFIRFPKKVEWRRVLLEPGDFDRLMYIANEPSWDLYSEKRAPQKWWPIKLLVGTFLTLSPRRLPRFKRS